MIVGLGNDICKVERVEKALARFGDRFKRRLFTDNECRYADRSPHHAATRYAQFFAAKEACAKALGSGIADGVFWRDIEILHRKSGAPYLQLTGGAAAKLNNASCHVTLSADGGIANAVVVLESPERQRHE